MAVGRAFIVVDVLLFYLGAHGAFLLIIYMRYLNN